MDLLLCLSQEALEKYLNDLKIRGTAVIDSFYVRKCPHPKTICLPFSETAHKELGRELFTNVLIFGAVARITGVMKLNSLAVANRVPKQFLEINQRTLELGWNLPGLTDR